ncbi:MAG TPA: response regulator [bacterium]|nr:response regulator [bacterium]
MFKVMIVDEDVRQSREIIDEIGLHYHVLNCSRGAKALDLCRAFQPDALILDPATPGLNAQELIAETRNQPGASRAPVLLMTHFTTIRHIEKSFDWGVDFVFSKPCSTDRLGRKLAEFMGKAARYRQTQLVEL